MKKSVKRLLSLLLAFVMLMSTTLDVVYASETAQKESVTVYFNVVGQDHQFYECQEGASWR